MAGPGPDQKLKTRPVPAAPGSPFASAAEVLGGMPPELESIKPPKDAGIDIHTDATLRQLLDVAFQDNPSTRMIWQQANVAAAGVTGAKSAYYPSLTLGPYAKPSYGRAPNFPDAGNSKTVEADYAPQFSISYLLLDFGGRHAALDAARFTLLAANYGINQTLQTVGLQVLKSYYGLAAANETVQVYGREQEVIKQLSRTITNTAAAYRDAAGGLTRRAHTAVSKTDAVALGAAANDNAETAAAFTADQAQVLPIVTQAQLSLEMAQAAQAAAQVQLAASAGLSGTDIRIAPFGRPPKDYTISDQETQGDIEALLAEALRRRPDIANLFALFKAADDSAIVAHSNIYPNLMLGVSGGTTFSNLGKLSSEPRSSNYTFGRTDAFAATATVNVTVFDGFNLLSKYRSAQASAQVALANLENGELAARADVLTNFLQYKYALEEYNVNAALAIQSLEAYKKQKALYLTPNQKKPVTITDLLTTYGNLATAEAGFVLAKLAVYNSSVMLANSVGVLLPAIANGQSPGVYTIAQLLGNTIPER